MASSSQTTGGPAYPVRFSVEYPDRKLNRLTTAFRLIVAIPILILAASIGGHEGTYAAGEQSWRIAGGTGGLLFLAPLLMILFRQKYPRWWFDWNLELLWFSILFTGRYPLGLFDFVLGVFRWTNRVVGYAFILVTDEYPPFRLNP